MYQVVRAQQINAVVVPLCLFLQILKAPHIHVGSNHQIARAIVLATNIGVACGSFNLCHLIIAEDAVTIQQVVVMETVSAQRIGRPSASMIIHVTIEVAIVASLQIPLLLGLRSACNQQR